MPAFLKADEGGPGHRAGRDAFILACGDSPFRPSSSLMAPGLQVPELNVAPTFDCQEMAVTRTAFHCVAMVWFRVAEMQDERSTDSDGPSNGGSRSVGRALALLKVVCDEGSVSMASAARITCLAASTALRLLPKLEESGFVRRDEHGEFFPGPTPIGLGAQALSRNRIVRSARRIMRELAVRLGESIFLSVRRSDDSGVYIASAQGTHPIR
ncbi:helix-turn-helix domain-containing protein [Streptomyces sp. NPDC127033]|uniref:helix-turn-helix domain-containing protein n=1 Tax=Streptomyces sp. NPDC127033 TaxID=3347110 RepID=UPI0036484DD6